MNVLIVGFGTAGKFYLEILREFKSVNKIYIFDKNKIKKSNLYETVNFDASEISKRNIKYAIVATPSNLHYKYAKILLEQNINILIEKPFVLKLSDAKKLIKLTTQKKLKCWVAFQNRHNLAMSQLKKVIDSKQIGNISLIDAALFWCRDFKYYQVGWRGKYETDGGVLANQAIHLLDALVYVFKKVKKFNFIIDYNKKKLEAEDLIVLNLVHANRSISSLKATTRADTNYSSSIDVIGESGRVVVKGISLNTFHKFKHNQIVDDKKNSENFESGVGAVGAMGNGHLKILKEFLNIKNLNSSKDLEISKNLHVLEIIHSVYNAARNKKNISLLVKRNQSQLGL